MNVSLGIIVILLLIVVWQSSIYTTCMEFFNSAVVKAKNGDYYRVVSSYNDTEEAANKISEINLFTINLIKKLQSVYIVSKGSTPEYIKGFEVTSILLDRFRSESLSENDPVDFTKTSYTKNKGEQIALCLREKNSGYNKLHSTELLKFVMLHELAHIITPELQHSSTFWTNFRFLLDFCKKYNLYQSENYAKNNVTYCGLNIEYNPAYDAYTMSYFDSI